MEVTAAQPGVVVLSEASYPGWRVTVNGKTSNIIRLNYLFQGVEVGSGRQQIQFEYQPPFFLLYLLISISAFVVIMLLWFFRYSLKRKI
ncbi:MAG: YfhO family protein [Ignavibacteriales bacterium]|nr:YfhO family protein [Ignavibacteriales bacterium]